jgi:hypothetical protein
MRDPTARPREAVEPPRLVGPGGLTGDDVPVPGTDLGRVLSTGKPILTRGECVERAPALIRIEDRAHHPAGHTAIVIVRAAQILDPHRLPRRPHDPELAAIERTRGDRATNRRFDPRAVIGVDQGEERGSGAGKLLGRDAMELIALGGPLNGVIPKVPGPDPGARGLQREPEPGTIFIQPGQRDTQVLRTDLQHGALIDQLALHRPPLDRVLDGTGQGGGTHPVLAYIVLGTCPQHGASGVEAAQPGQHHDGTDRLTGGPADQLEQLRRIHVR